VKRGKKERTILEKASLFGYTEAMTDEPKRDHHIFLFLWLGWFVISAALILAFLPRMRNAFQESGVSDLMATRKEPAPKADGRSVGLFFYDAKGETALYSQNQKRLGGDLAHDTLEALLSGPDEQNVRKGATTYIEAKTRLIGCTSSSGTMFVELSKEFTQSPDMEKAVREVEDTMLNLPAVHHVEILIEGKTYHLPATL